MIHLPKGTRDILPSEIHKWYHVEAVIRRLCDDFGYREIRTPVFESTDLFVRGVGDTTDIVQKEMFTLTDAGGRSLTLRPEGTSPVVRAVLENGLYAGPLPLKVYYNPLTCYRAEKPQAGRQREFHQFGVELFGAATAAADAEVILIAYELFRRFGLAERLLLKLNSIGCPDCRARYRQALLDFLRPHAEELCETCRGRMERNPMRVFDCKSEICQGIAAGAPLILDYLCDDCAAHFEQLKETLTALEIPFEVDASIVRGLDYYRRTVFEFVSGEIGAQSTVCGGGRYDGLVEELGGDPLAGIGFGLGIERLIMTLDSAGYEFPPLPGIAVYVGMTDASLDVLTTKLVTSLRRAGISAEKDIVGRSVKAQMKYAGKLGVRFAAIIGGDEVAAGTVRVKDMQGGEPFEAPLDRFAEVIAEKL
ncbi:MAG: histidine--tRNA ligase [Clostridia bacterium]|nr:histidine--tRNA ligase [Clostridia bacterium]